MPNCDDLTFHVPLACQGQIVEVAYALDGETEILVRRTTDRSDGAVSYETASLDDLQGEFQPQHEEPEIDGEWIAA